MLLGEVRFSDYRRVFQLYTEGMAGQRLGLVVVSGNIESYRELPGTDGRTVYLPEMVGEYPARADNFRWYKVSLLHQLGYYEFGTFSHPGLDFAEHFARFQNPGLAALLFQILEDARIDWSLERRYRGAAVDIRRLKADTVKARLAPSLTTRGQLLEAMLQYSLDGEEFGFVSGDTRLVLAKLLEAMSGLKHDANLTDTLEALAYCYELILPYVTRQDEQQDERQGEASDNELCGDEPEAVSFRGQLDPAQVSATIDMIQTEALDAIAHDENSQLPGSKVDAKSLEVQQFKRGDVNQDGMVITDAEGSAAEIDEANGDGNEDKVGSTAESSEKAHDAPMEDRTYQYDEWDYLIGRYRRRWCTLFEIREIEDRPEFVDDTLTKYRDIALGVRSRLSLLNPEMLRKVKGMADGEELDLDKTVEAVVDRQSGFTPGDRIYIQRQRQERDVSALFLLDMSASTDDVIPDSPDRQPSVHEQRIIDVEKQAVVLMAEALKDLGDSYSICGFSGYGRDRVEFFLCKDFDESFDRPVKGRIGGIKPCRSTRMGPAIRHATYNLRQTGSRIQALIIISDGYPQDFDYGKDRNSKEYGIRDTTRALAEARQHGVQTFCLTVDPSGHDYLREMCPDRQYMVIQEIAQLPNELSKVYRALTS